MSLRRIGRALGPALVTVALLIWYFVAPLDRPWSPAMAVGLVVGLLLFGAFVVWQVRRVASSPTPRLRAAGVLAFSAPLLMLLFAASYVAMSNTRRDAFSETLTRIDALYFAVTVFATVGFGDIAPLSQAARLLVLVQVVVDLVYIGLLGRVLYEAARIGISRRDGGE